MPGQSTISSHSRESEEEYYHFFYLSSARVTSVSDQIDAILAASRRNNVKADVTGMLLFHEGSFIQYLEGPQAGVVATRARIAVDVRHSGMLKLSDGPVAQRVFGEWSMGFRQNNSLPELQSFHFDLDALEKRLPETTPTMARTMMRTVFQTAR